MGHVGTFVPCPTWNRECIVEEMWDVMDLCATDNNSGRAEVVIELSKRTRIASIALGRSLLYGHAVLGVKPLQVVCIKVPMNCNQSLTI